MLASVRFLIRNPLWRRAPRGFTFDRVTSVQPTGIVEAVYDITTEDHEFVANGIVIHNCHQATSCLDKVNDPSEGGHGREWQAWMRKVGLDPRRFDPTEETVYQDKVTQAISEDKLNRAYGPRTPVAEYKNREKVEIPTSLEVLVEIHGRLMRGKFKKVRGGYQFNCTAPNKAELIFTFRAFPKDRTYKL